MTTLWLSDDEEIDLYEYYELLREARDDVDKRYPRDGTQAQMIDRWYFECSRSGKFERWSDAHGIMRDLQREFDDEEWA